MTYLFYFLVFVLSSSIVSFLTVMGHDFPKIEFNRRSACDNCHKILAWFELFPVLGYILLRGRCRNCQNKIHWIYPATEFLGGVFVLTGLALGKNIYLFAPIFIMMILFAFMDHYHGFIYPIFYILSIPTFVFSILNHNKIYLLVGLGTYTTLYLLHHFGKSIGLGDVELLTILALLFGYNRILSIILFACALCILHFLLQKKRSFRFVPYLTIATGIVYLIS